jgi:choice-of-anchor C domain-containing protein
VGIVNNKAVYTPSANFVGSDTFSYTVKDSAGLTSTASVAVTVNAVNDGPTIKFLPQIINGSFEQPGTGGNTFNGGSTAIAGWTVTGANVDYIPTSTWQAAHGSFSLDLNGFNTGGVKQTFATVPGQTYTLGFELSQNNLGTSSTVRVAAGSTVKDYVFNLDTTAPNDMKWQGQTFTFTATGNSTDLSFTSLNAGANGPALDNVVSVATKENTSTVIRGLDVADPDAGGNPINIQLSVSHGALSLNSVAGLVALDSNGSDGTISYAGPQASINAALASGVVYAPAANYSGGDTLVATVNDAGWSGGGNLAATTNVGIAVYDVTLPQPISLWLADGNATDNIAPANNGTLNGGVGFTAGRNGGQAFNFDGLNDYVAVGRELTNDFTVFGWMKTTQVAPSGSQFFHGDGLVYADVGGVNNDFGISQVGTKIAFGTGNPDTSILSTSDVNTGNWVQFAAVRNGSVLSLWINGVQEASINTGNSGALATPPNIIFGGNTVDGRYFQGQMDDIQFFDHALTPVEVIGIMNVNPG